MLMMDIIAKKRNGVELTDEEINFVVNGYTDDKIPDYQMSALLMAICFNSMNERETARLTLAMARSGEMLDLSCFGSKTVDKHSTGGVGDKTTLIVAPIAAACGAVVAKMSGRGLGFTGGTADKLESINGYKVSLTGEDFFSQVKKVGIAVATQTGNLAPADKKIYALRDVTATVESIPLIASSIMSKKIASGSHSILLDVKVGSGAFMKTEEDAEQLAQQMVDIGKRCGRNMCAVLTDMDVPLGNSIGNNLEVVEAIEILRGAGNQRLRELCIELAAQMLRLSLEVEIENARHLARQSLDSGNAYKKFKEWIECQGGDAAELDNTDLFKKAEYVISLEAWESGYIGKTDTSAIGHACVLLGAGRTKVGAAIDPTAGIVFQKQYGDMVKKGDEIALLHTNNASIIENVKKEIKNAIKIQEKTTKFRQTVYRIIQ